MHSISNFSHVIRIFNLIHPLKCVPSHHLHFLYRNEAIKSSRCSYRIICTTSARQSALHHNYQTKTEIVPYQPAMCVPALYPKDNVAFPYNHCARQVSFPSECHNIEHFIQDMEFKKILANSAFYYDVNLIENSHRLASSSSVYYYSFEDVHPKTLFVEPSEKHSLDCVSEVLMAGSSEVKENDTGKPTESQLLNITDKLTHQLHNFFTKSPDYSFYHRNIVFQNNLKGVTVRGLSSYMQTMYLLKIYGHLRFVKVNVEILKITHHIEDGTIRVRWRVKGILLHKMLLKIWKMKSFSWKEQEESEWLDGFSVFSVGQDGLIYHHVCDKMTPNSDNVVSKKADFKSRLLGLFELSPRGPAAGSLNALIPFCRNQEFSSFKKST